MFPNWITYILRYFALYSFHTTSFRSKYVYTIIRSVHISLASWCSFVAISSFFQLTHIMEQLDVINFITYYSISTLTYWLIIYESFTCQQDFNNFWDILSRIDNKFINQIHFLFPWKFLLLLFFIKTTDICFTVFSFFNELMSSGVQKIMNFVFMNITINRLFFYLLHLCVIEFQLQHIRIEMRKIQKTLRSHQNRSNIENTKKLFKWLRNYHSLVCELSRLFNSMFGWSQTAYILLNCYSFITFLNFFYRQVNEKFITFNHGKYIIKV